MRAVARNTLAIVGWIWLILAAFAVFSIIVSPLLYDTTFGKWTFMMVVWILTGSPGLIMVKLSRKLRPLPPHNLPVGLGEYSE